MKRAPQEPSIPFHPARGIMKLSQFPRFVMAIKNEKAVNSSVCVCVGGGAALVLGFVYTQQSDSIIMSAVSKGRDNAVPGWHHWLNNFHFELGSGVQHWNPLMPGQASGFTETPLPVWLLYSANFTQLDKTNWDLRTYGIPYRPHLILCFRLLTKSVYLGQI